MELQVGCRQPTEECGPGLVRYGLAGKLVKGQPLGGVLDEWVVIQDIYEAAGLAEQLHDDPADGNLLFGRFHFKSRYQWFRDWVNGPDGQRLGLASIPGDRLTLRMLRRKLAIELTYRPGGLPATKIYLHHVSTATTEGCASRPGGPQPNCWPRSTTTNGNAISNWFWPSSATTSRASCQPVPAPAASPSSSPASTKSSPRQPHRRRRPSAVTATCSTC